ncbi:hypothetical protein FACS1894158_13500 [Betaproteobacteria bacterium]|nr:hypothetical protein FACS1894158_13500 [Betaproteobacteria bacterium]
MTINKGRGFTLIELLVVVAIIAILSAIAIPLYQDYVKRSKIMPAIQGLSERQTRMEQCYQDHPKDGYAATACASIGSGVNGEFSFSFDADPTKETFKLKASGGATMTGFTYTVDQANNKTSTIATPFDQWNATSSTCWITNKGGQPCQ